MKIAPPLRSQPAGINHGQINSTFLLYTLLFLLYTFNLGFKHHVYSDISKYLSLAQNNYICSIIYLISKLHYLKDTSNSNDIISSSKVGSVSVFSLLGNGTINYSIAWAAFLLFPISIHHQLLLILSAKYFSIQPVLSTYRVIILVQKTITSHLD